MNGRVRTSARTCARACLRLHVHCQRARIRTKIRSTRVDLITPYFCTCEVPQYSINKGKQGRARSLTSAIEIFMYLCINSLCISVSTSLSDYVRLVLHFSVCTSQCVTACWAGMASYNINIFFKCGDPALRRPVAALRITLKKILYFATGSFAKRSTQTTQGFDH